MPYGRKKNYKGRSRRFTSGLGQEGAEEKDPGKWREKAEGEESDDESGSGSEEESSEEEEKAEAAPPGVREYGKVEVPVEEEEDSGSDSDDFADLSRDNFNPHQAAVSSKKKAEALTRKQREALEKEEAKKREEKLYAEGKTEQAKADLARLALIRKQREEAAKKREEERLAKEAAKAKSSGTVAKK
eukprot:Colp12_sorted_trinity150504_noHs@12216